MENNEIMQRLLQEDSHSDSAKNEGKNVKGKQGEESTISRIRIVTAKYKVYIVFLAIVICALLMVYIPKADDALDSNEKTYEQVENRLSSIEREINYAKADMVYLCDDNNGVVKNEDNIKTCLNGKENCSSLPEGWKTGTGNNYEDYGLTIPLSYLQLHSLYNNKMPVDEKRVLKNLNEYLIKQDIAGGDRNRVGDILRIEIGDPEIIGYSKQVNSDGKEVDVPNFFTVTVDVEIEFTTVDDLVGFLYNVEKKLIDNGDERILYKIQSVSYDIVTNDEPQVTDISMVAYYYHDERFDNKTECVEDSEGTSETTNETTNEENNTNVESNDDSGSFFKGLLQELKN